MGYTTEFDGTVSVEPPLNPSERAYLLKFSQTRRMDRSGGPYFVDGSGMMGQGDGPDTIFDYKPPERRAAGALVQVGAN